MLGVRNSSVFLPNCNIWVEGISDVMYFRDYLDIYQEFKLKEDTNFKKFREDLHYSFYKYDGSDINNLLGLELDDTDKRLERLYLIRDWDDPKDKKKKVKDNALKKLLKDKFCLLGRREIENLIDQPVLLKILENDKRFRNIDIEDFEYDDYKTIKLNEFINDICNNELKEKFIGKSGKMSFHKRTQNYINNWDDLSPEAQEITEMIYNFIKENNF